MNLDSIMPFGKFKVTPVRDLDPAYLANLIQIGMLNFDTIEVLKLALIKKLKINPFSTEILDKELKFKIQEIDFDNNLGLLAFKKLNENQISWLMVQLEAIYNAKIETL